MYKYRIMKVQIDVDQVLWRDVKIEAMKRGDLLREFVSGALSRAVGESVKPVVGLGANRMSSQGGSTPPSGAKPVVGQSGDAGTTCSMCGKTGVKTAMNKDRKWICYECAGVKS